MNDWSIKYFAKVSHGLICCKLRPELWIAFLIIKQAIFKTSTFLYVNISGKVKNNKIFLCIIMPYKNGRSWLDSLFPIFLELTPYTTRKQFFEYIRSHFYAVVVGLNIFKSQPLSFYLITSISIAALVTNKWKE